MGYKIRRSTAKELLKAAGYELADQYTDKTLARKLSYLNDLPEEEAAAKIIGPLKRVFGTLRLALREGQQPEVIDDPVGTTPMKPLGRPKSEDTVETTIIALLTKASEDDPITKRQVTDALEEKFPDRDRATMREAVDKWIMSYCRRDGHDIRKNPKGFWIETPEE